RNSRIASVLIRSAPEADAEASPRSPWWRGLLWTTAGAGLVVGVLGFYLIRIHVPDAIARGDWGRAETGLRVSRWLGADEPLLRDQLVAHFTKVDDTARAAAQAERLVGLRADGRTYALVGEMELARGETEAARTAFETAVAKG